MCFEHRADGDELSTQPDEPAREAGRHGAPLGRPLGHPYQVVSPAWHGEELLRRREQVKQGSAKFLNWDDAIAELKTERHEHQTP